MAGLVYNRDLAMYTISYGRQICWPQELFKRALKEADKATVVTEPAPELQEALPWEAAEDGGS